MSELEAKKTLYRSRKNTMVAGVCGGLAEVYEVDINLVRIVAACLVLGTGFGIIAYIAAVVLLPVR